MQKSIPIAISTMYHIQLVMRLLLPALSAVNSVYGDFVLNVTLTERNNPVRATCSYSLATSSTLFILNNANVQNTSLTSCSVSVTRCLPQNWPPYSPFIYKFGVSTNSSWVEILSLNRTRDQEVWKCVLGDGFLLGTLNLTVFTSPIGIDFVSSLPTDIDLAETFLSVQCQTTECGYPAPIMTWYYETDTERVPITEGTRIGNSSSTSCSQDEQKYTTNLTLSRGTVFPGKNVPMTAKLRCGISHDTFNGTRLSQLSVNVSFAVALTYVNISGTTNITEGTSAMFTCITSISRPLATVQWFIGNTSVTTRIQNFNRTDSSGSFFVESRLTFNPEGISHHGKNIVCQAYTTDSNNVQRSDNLTLYVKVPLTYVNINGTTNITQGTATHFTCITSISRPLATVQWFIGNLSVTSGIQDIDRIDSSGLHFVESRLTFDPDGINHHGKEIFCQAYNIDPNNLTISAKPALFVIVYITSVTLSPAGPIITFLDGEEKNLTCTTSRGRPQPIIRWWLDGMETKTGIMNTITFDRTLTIVSSELYLTLNKSHMNSQVYCDARVTGQPNIIESSNGTINVWYWPALPSVQTVNGDFPWLENRTGILNCKTDDLGNPQASVTWSNSSGVINNLKQLVFSNLSAQDHGQVVYCQLQNNFTNIKGIHVVSPNVTLNVEYTATITLNTSQPIVTVEEGKTLSIMCAASGNPTPVVQWQNKIPPSSLLHIPDIRRDHAGSYTCVASTKSTNYGGILLSREKNVAVTVNYAPDVLIRLSGSTLINSTAFLTCIAFGDPSTYAFHEWVHKVGETEIRKLTGQNADKTSILTLTNISIEDMGTYVCSVDNNITGLDGQIKQTGYTDIFVKGPPFTTNKDIVFIGVENKSAEMDILFYSNPPSRTIAFNRGSNNVQVTNTSDTSIYLYFSLIAITFYGKQVFINGQVAVCYIRTVQTTDFGEYTVFLYNDIGIASQTILLSSGEPEKPANFHIADVQETQVTVKWLSGDHIGFDQTFVIQSSMDNISWINASLINAGKKNGWLYSTITGLKSNTVYYFRLYSYNVNGRGDFADVQFATKTLKEDASSFDISAALGISFGGFLLGVVGTISVIVVRKRFIATRKYRSSRETDMGTEVHTYANTRVSSLTVPSDYEELHQDKMEKTVYDQI